MNPAGGRRRLSSGAGQYRSSIMWAVFSVRRMLFIAGIDLCGISRNSSPGDIQRRHWGQ